MNYDERDKNMALVCTDQMESAESAAERKAAEELVKKHMNEYYYYVDLTKKFMAQGRKIVQENNLEDFITQHEGESLSSECDCKASEE